MPRIPLPSGSRIAVVNAPDDALVLRPRTPSEGIADVGAAVRDALRFPLSGAPLEALVKRGGRVTIVVEPPELPLPGAPNDPRREALAATLAELERLGVPSRQQTILVAGGLNRRAGDREQEALLPPVSARRFHGRVEVHDAEAPDLVHLGDAGRTPIRVNRGCSKPTSSSASPLPRPCCTAAPARCSARAARRRFGRATAYSLLETAAARGWQLGLALERTLAARVPVIGDVARAQSAAAARSLPRLSLRGGVARPARQLASAPVLPPPARVCAAGSSRISRRELTAVAAFAGPPSVAHAEALLRGIARRSIRLEQPLDAIVIGMPWKHHHSPRERLNPLTVATVALGLALRLWRDAFPVVEGGTAIVLHRLSRHFAHGTQDPYRALFHALRDGRTGAELAAGEQAAATDERATRRLPRRPRLPSAPALRRLGQLPARRSTGSAPSSSPAAATTRPRARSGSSRRTESRAALEMAHGRAGGEARIGYLLSPPYFPLEVGSA